MHTVHEVLHNTMKKRVMQVFILIPGTPSNLGAYMSWHRSGARQAGVSLPDHTSGALKVGVNAGETLFIPGMVASLPLVCLCACSMLSLCLMLRFQGLVSTSNVRTVKLIVHLHQ